MRFRVLGPLDAVGSAALGGPQERRLLALLLVRRGQVTSRDQLADVVWPQQAPDDVMSSLHTKISRLRRIAPEIERAPAGYVLAVGPDDVDADVFERSCLAAESASPAAAIELLEPALALWRGPAFADLDGATIDRGPIVRLEAMRRTAAERLVDALMSVGRHREAATVAERALLVDQFDDRLWGALIRAHGLARHRSAARSAYRRYCAAMAELGAVPDPTITALDAEIAAGGAPAAHEPTVASVRTDVAIVGRNAVLDDIDMRIDRALSGAEPTAIVLTGGAGMGKTRLVHEVLARRSSSDVDIGWGRFDAEGSMPLRMLEQACAPLLPPGQRLVDGLVLAATSRRQRSELPIRDVVDEMLDHASGRPTIIVVEDLHWADRTSIDLLSQLAEELSRRAHVKRPLPIAVIVTTRPDAIAHRAAVARLERASNVVVHELGGLDELALFQLIQESVGSRPSPSFARRLSESTSGNPLLALATLRRACAAGALRLVDGRVDLAGRLRVALPGDLADAVGQLLDLVPERAAVMLGRCACIGREAEVWLLAAVAQVDAGEVRAALEPAARLGIVAIDDDTVTFHHELFRRHLLERITEHDAAEIDRAVAHELAALPSPSDATIVRIARHLNAAADRVDPRRLMDAAERAGDVALSGASWSEAARWYDAAIGARRTLVGAEPAAQLLWRAGLAHFRNHDAVAAIERLDAAMVAARRDGDLRTEGDALLIRQRIALTIDDRGPTVREELYHGYLAAAGDAVPELRAEVYAQMAEFAFAARRHADGQRWSQRAVELGDRLGSPVLILMTAIGEGFSSLGMLDLDAARRCFDRAWALGDAEDIWYRSGVAARQGIVSIIGDDPHADTWLRLALELGERSQNWSEVSLAWALAAMRDLTTGDPAAAVTKARQSLAHYARSSYAFSPEVAYPALMAAYARIGNAVQARAELRNWEAQRGRPSPVYRLLLAVETSDDDLLSSEVAQRPLASMLGGELDVTRMVRPAAAALAARRLGDRVVLAAAASELDELVARGAVRAIGWPLDLVAIVADARAELALPADQR